jgi:methyltransferase
MGVDMKVPNLRIALPDSALVDVQTKRDKTLRICQFARACSIFRVGKIYIYHDKSSKASAEDISLLETILRYLDTPQYLRKLMFPRTAMLEYAGIMHPINAPHHRERQRLEDLKSGDVRVGVIQRVKGALFVDVGMNILLPFEGRGSHGERVNIKVTSSAPSVRCTNARVDDIKENYWGYEVEKSSGIHELMESAVNTLIIVTSKQGHSLKHGENQLSKCIHSFTNLLIVFGAPRRSVEEILASEGRGLDPDLVTLNMFPSQGTKTVRLEEAILGSLAIFNYFLSRENLATI